MARTSSVITAELVCTDLSAGRWEEVLDALSDRLLAQGMVRDSFPEAVKVREREFPTGLPTAEVGVAIPHTDPEHVLHAGAALATLARPVRFKLMGNPDEEVEVELVIMLAVRSAKDQIGILQRLVDAFQVPGLLRRLKEERDPAVLADMLGRILEGPDPNGSCGCGCCCG